MIFFFQTIWANCVIISKDRKSWVFIQGKSCADFKSDPPNGWDCWNMASASPPTQTGTVQGAEVVQVEGTPHLKLKINGAWVDFGGVVEGFEVPELSEMYLTNADCCE